MITIEKILNILKADQNFREVIDNDYYYFNYKGLVFHDLSYDSREIKENTLFLQKAIILKLVFLKMPSKKD